MTATPQPESKSPSRRALLAGALGGLGALAASAIGRASPVRAEGEAIVVGGEYATATSQTKIVNQTNNADVLVAESTGLGYAVWGHSAARVGVAGSSVEYFGVKGVSQQSTGVYGSSGTWIGVQGVSGSSTGVFGSSQSWIGVQGNSNASDAPATLGFAKANSTGVLGYSGNGSLPATKPKTGVYGYADQDISSRGVYGESPAGHGVHGKSATGFAGWFNGKVYTNAFHEMTEIGTPRRPGLQQGTAVPARQQLG
jgi:hypothetical protein